MMKTLCLTSNETETLLAQIVDTQHILEGNLANYIEAAKSWELKIICHTLFIARHIATNADGLKKVDRVYAVTNEIAIELQEGDVDFVDYLLKNQRIKNQTLDDELIGVQERFSNYDYEKTICR